MKAKLILLMLLNHLASVCGMGPASSAPSASSDAFSGREHFAVAGDRGGKVQFRLYTNACPDAPHLLNTFDLEAYGSVLLRAPVGAAARPWLSSPPGASLHSILINGEGPTLGETNSMRLSERGSGPEWSYIELDGSAAYQDRLKEYRRGILFIEPDLVVLYDHLLAKEPVDFKMLLHAPAETELDPVWHDLRLQSSTAGFRIQVPSRRGALRSWERWRCPADELLPGQVTMAVGPTNKVTQLDVLTVFAVYPQGQKANYVFKLLESNDAVGARIHRNGLPTLVAFRTSTGTPGGSLTGFRFEGPVGVAVFRPKQPR